MTPYSPIFLLNLDLVLIFVLPLSVARISETILSISLPVIVYPS